MPNYRYASVLLSALHRLMETVKRKSSMMHSMENRSLRTVKTQRPRSQV